MADSERPESVRLALHGRPDVAADRDDATAQQRASKDFIVCA